MISRYKLSAFFSISVLVTCLFGCGMSLQESLVGEWKGHLTEKTQSYMRKQAITFRFDAKGNAEVKLDGGNVERNTFVVTKENAVIFTRKGKEGPEARWEPVKKPDELHGSVVLLDANGALRRKVIGVLHLKRVNK